MEKKIIELAEILCKKFINKVESGRARSTETYADCKQLLTLILEYYSSQGEKKETS